MGVYLCWSFRCRLYRVTPTKLSQIRRNTPYVCLSFDAGFPRTESKPSSRFQSAYCACVAMCVYTFHLVCPLKSQRDSYSAMCAYQNIPFRWLGPKSLRRNVPIGQSEHFSDGTHKNPFSSVPLGQSERRTVYSPIENKG